MSNNTESTADLYADHLGAPIVEDETPTEYTIQYGRGKYFYSISRPKNRAVFDTLVDYAKKHFPHYSVLAKINGVVAYEHTSKGSK